MAQKTFMVERVVQMGGGRRAVVTSVRRNETTFQLFAGDRVRLTSPLSEAMEFQVPCLVMFAPSKVTDRLVFELPGDVFTDVTGWAGTKKV